MGLTARFHAPHRARPTRSGLIVGVLLAGPLLGGCVRSEKSMYAGFLSNGIGAEAADDPALAMAFGLDGHELPTLASAATESSLTPE